MADGDDDNVVNDDVLDLVDEVEDEQADDEQQVEQEDDGEEIVTFDGEDVPAQDDDTPLVKQLRAQIKERDRLLSEQRKPAEPEKVVEVGERPKLKDFDYDEDAYEAAFEAWEERGRHRAEQDKRRDADQQRANEEWAGITRAYADKKAALRFADKDQVEAKVIEELPQQHVALIAKVARDPALFVYAAGKNPARLAALAAITDPFKLMYEVGAMEKTLQVKRKGPRTEPEQIVRGGAVRAGGSKEEERLKKEADRTGNVSALVRHRANSGARKTDPLA